MILLAFVADLLQADGSPNMPRGIALCDAVVERHLCHAEPGSAGAPRGDAAGAFHRMLFRLAPPLPPSAAPLPQKQQQQPLSSQVRGSRATTTTKKKRLRASAGDFKVAQGQRRAQRRSGQDLSSREARRRVQERKQR
eukprot:CAMPEP_0206456790 /NCGR_PEP_ID=MMETSP0324_2-20121206/22576_1 /ASSEMBLY_ACC=CAM_ASM_000836 /TAXON_ID=2866 /ORGANISM="Crypthecodinium cohnii, Strain Seligo" /LENGTH=137 /DNA_ID=CAMNT_0053927789 /DNA_START=1156 /DNA_END=1568 /DNA_ORIENTATION=+